MQIPYRCLGPVGTWPVPARRDKLLPPTAQPQGCVASPRSGCWLTREWVLSGVNYYLFPWARTSQLALDITFFWMENLPNRVFNPPCWNVRRGRWAKLAETGFMVEHDMPVSSLLLLGTSSALLSR